MEANSNITVIIPVFNAEKFLVKAVESVLIQEEVDEIILIEDGSPDSSLTKCQEFVNLYPNKIKLFTHSPIKNKGAAVSRNLGIANAKNEYLAFLDVDDYYLPNRFKNAIKILRDNSDVDGVYEAIGTHYYDEEGQRLHRKRMEDLKIPGLSLDMTTLTQPVAPELLFEKLIMGNLGWFHFNGLTLRKSAIEKAGLLDPYLWYGQDIEFFLRLAIYAKLIPGNLNQPVAMRGVYAQNSTLSIYTNEQRKFVNNRCSAYRWKKIFIIMLEKDFPMHVNRFVFNRFVDSFDDRMTSSEINFKRKIYKIFVILQIIYRYKKSYQKVIG